MHGWLITSHVCDYPGTYTRLNLCETILTKGVIDVFVIWDE